MTTSSISQSGLPSVGSLDWGSHFCHFYRSRDDLAESLVPYFRAGLDANEQCLWVTSEPLPAAAARSALNNVVDDLDGRVDRGQIEIIDYRDWYLRNQGLSAQEVLQGWVERQNQALARGYQGLRLTGNTHWLEHEHWRDFADYEATVNETFRHYRIIGLCSYSLDRCRPDEIIDVVRNHDFALIRRDGDWEVIENANVKLAKRELVRLNEVLEQRVAERTAELEAALRVRDEFLSIAAHELKTPVTSLRGFAQLALRQLTEHRQPDPQRLGRALDVINAQSQRLGKLIDLLLDVSRIESGQLEIQPVRTRLDALIERVVVTAQVTTDRHWISLDRLTPVMASVDPMRLEQVLANLLENAIRYSPHGGEIQVSLAPGEAAVEIAVRDWGPGVPVEHRGRIFERFHRAHAASDAAGLGLGLYICRQIVDLHGGTLRAEFPADGGTRMTISLPQPDRAGCTPPSS